jgi:hypothetical protein
MKISTVILEKRESRDIILPQHGHQKYVERQTIMFHPKMM